MSSPVMRTVSSDRQKFGPRPPLRRKRKKIHSVKGCAFDGAARSVIQIPRPASALASRCTHQPAEDLCGDSPKMTKADIQAASREFRVLLVHILGMRG